MQQEILLALHSSFAQLQLNKVQKPESKKSSRRKTYEEDCINSLLHELLPIFFNKQFEGKMYLWQIHSGNFSLQFEFCDLPVLVEKTRSIDPHNFLVTNCYN